jgi:hypothetical protein
LRLELFWNVEDELLLSSDMGRITSLMFFSILPYLVNDIPTSPDETILAESVITISLGRTVVLYLISPEISSGKKKTTYPNPSCKPYIPHKR